MLNTAGMCGRLCRANRLRRQALCDGEVADVGNEHKRESARGLAYVEMTLGCCDQDLRSRNWVK